MIVTDANVIIYWATDSPHASQVEQLRQYDPDWRTVPLWRYEFASAMVTMIRAKVMSESAALKALDLAAELMTPREHAVPQAEVLAAALRYDISAYDAQYIVLAELSNAKCVTADAPLARKTPKTSVLLSQCDRLGEA
jgi:predicted nucleic acid-binding protein